MHPQVRKSRIYGLVVIGGMALVWYLDSIKSWIVWPIFFGLMIYTIAFSPMVGNIRYIRDRWKGPGNPDEIDKTSKNEE